VGINKQLQRMISNVKVIKTDVHSDNRFILRALDMVASRELKDPKTIMLLQYLRLNRLV
jgi:type IV secretory pathway TrbF-like protein